MKKQHELIINIEGIEFFKGNTIDNGCKKEQMVFTNDENFRVDLDEDIIKACTRIYHNYY